MNYIKYVLSKDNTKLYTKINEVEKAKQILSLSTD